MADVYAVLAHVYKMAGLAEESEQLRARLFERVQSEGWLGRRILELGCGIGEASCWFALNGFRITAVDRSAEMLEQARQQAEALGVTVDWRQEDIRNLDVGTDYDLVLAMNTLNELHSIRELEAVFQAANRALAVGKLLLFDLVTIRGLAEQWGNRDRVLHDDPQALTLVVRSQFSFETFSNARSYLIFRRGGEQQWQRLDGSHVIRGFALQAVGTLLQRTGFKVQNVLNANFASFDPNDDQTGHAIFIVAKERDL